jgi:multidrug efflux pump
MTSLSTILGILPIALALGAGSEGRTPMGIAVVGGLTVGTFLTLYVVPAVYSYLTSEKAQTGLAFLEEGAASEAGRPEGGRPAVANGEAA